MNLSIVIVNYNTGVLLHNCLESLHQFPFSGSMEIIVVDNCSNDDSMLRAQPLIDSNRVIINHENVGFARANNQALRLCRGDFLLLLNPDTRVLEHTLDRMVGYAADHPRIGAIGPRTWLDDSHQLQICSLKLPTPSRMLALDTGFRRVIARPYLARIEELDHRVFLTPSGAVEVEGIGGAAFLLSRRHFEEIGLLDERYFMGYEDTDWCCKLARLGKGRVILCDAELVHYFGQSKKGREGLDDHLYSWDKAPLLYLETHFGDVRVKLYKALKRLESRSHPVPVKAASASATPITLSWPRYRCEAFLVEISNHPLFYDKFGAVVAEPQVLIPEATASRLAGGRYYWRVFAIEPSGTVRLPYGGQFQLGIAAADMTSTSSSS